MKQYQLYVGLNDKDAKTQIIPTKKALGLIKNVIWNYSDGATITTGTGLYRHENGQKVIEKTAIITINDYMDNQAETIKTILEHLKTALNQESVLVTATELIQCDLF